MVYGCFYCAREVQGFGPDNMLKGADTNQRENAFTQGNMIQSRSSPTLLWGGSKQRSMEPTFAKLLLGLASRAFATFAVSPTKRKVAYILPESRRRGGRKTCRNDTLHAQQRKSPCEALLSEVWTKPPKPATHFRVIPCPASYCAPPSPAHQLLCLGPLSSLSETSLEPSAKVFCFERLRNHEQEPMQINSNIC